MAHIHKLSNDILKDVLDHIESGSQIVVAIDRREHLSVESFRPPTPPPPSQAQDVANFRLVCRRFARLGIPYQYSRLSLRFSKTGFIRLDKICSHEHLTRHTRKFSYLVPPFYDNNNAALSRDRSGFAAHLRRKITEQSDLLTSAEDVRVLKKAMRSFTTLQHVQLLRLIEPAELNMTRTFVNLEWPPACTHATKTMSEALIHGKSQVCRFSGPMMEPHTARIVQGRMLSPLVSRLTCLELHFDGGLELIERMTELSQLARSVLQASKNLQAIHIGFPSRTPLDLRLSTVFHNIHWPNLRAFGIQAWRLDSYEIINLVKRHKSTLRGLRLRDVQLKKGSRWREILVVLRTEMRQLDWVSLRRIDYSDHFDSVWGNTMEVPDDGPGGLRNESSSDDEDDEEPDYPSDYSDQESIVGSQVEDSDEDEESLAGTDHGPEADDIAISPDTPSSSPFCTCDKSDQDYEVEDGEELGDDGTAVTYHQRKMWERWVIGKCPEHP